MSVLVSGGFAPPHDGHIEYILEAAKHGNVVVALNSDEWLMRKHGSVFMPWHVRASVIGAIKGVVSVVPVDDADGTVCKAIMEVQPEYFAKGGDRNELNTPEVELCRQLGVKLLFGLGAKINSSSEIVKRQWGEYHVLHKDPQFVVKLLIINPGKSTSVQRHKHRVEHWIYPDTNYYKRIEAGEVHFLSNPTAKPLQIVEVWTGNILSENDIERLA